MSAFPEEKPEGAPEWMVSYADMITIIMSFFVIMFAIASGEAAKGKRTQQQQAAIDSLQNRFGPKYQPFASWGLMPGNSPIRHAGAHEKGKQPIIVPDEEGGTVKVLKRERSRIRIPGRGDRIVIGGVVYFGDKTLALADSQTARLKLIAEEMAGKPQQIEIVGHTSARPLTPDSSFHDRWDLAYARCRQVAKLLGTMKIAPDRLRISVVQTSELQAAGETSTATAEDMRIDIYLTDMVAERATNTQ